MDFPLASDCQNEALGEIAEAGSMAPEGIPGHLLDVWDTMKHSCKYLNSEMDLDNIFYSHAYKMEAWLGLVS